MRVGYNVDGATWYWDTKSERWEKPWQKPEPVARLEVIATKPESAYDWTQDTSLGWNARLLHIYKESRSSVNWEGYKAMHDEEDQRYFDTLERYYQMGKLKIQEELQCVG